MYSQWHLQVLIVTLRCTQSHTDVLTVILRCTNSDTYMYSHTQMYSQSHWDVLSHTDVLIVTLRCTHSHTDVLKVTLRFNHSHTEIYSQWHLRCTHSLEMCQQCQINVKPTMRMKNFLIKDDRDSEVINKSSLTEKNLLLKQNIREDLHTLTVAARFLSAESEDDQMLLPNRNRHQEKLMGFYTKDWRSTSHCYGGCGLELLRW